MTCIDMFFKAFILICMLYGNQSISFDDAILPQDGEAESPTSTGVPPLDTPIDEAHGHSPYDWDAVLRARNVTVSKWFRSMDSIHVEQLERKLLHKDAIIDSMNKSMQEKDDEIARLQTLLRERQPVTVITVKENQVPVALPYTTIGNNDQVEVPPLFRRPQYQYKGDLYKTRLCNKFANGNGCPFGRRCQFAHGLNELRVRNAPSQGTI